MVVVQELEKSPFVITRYQMSALKKKFQPNLFDDESIFMLRQEMTFHLKSHRNQVAHCSNNKGAEAR